MSNKTWLKYRRGNVYSVSFPTVPSLTAKPSEVDLYQEGGGHDLLELTFIRESSAWSNLLSTGTPVVFTWNQGTNSKTWTGVVNHVSTQSASQQERTMKVVCVGASYALKKRASRTWKNKTITEVASIIAKQFFMNFVGEPSTKRFEQLSMTGQSYWKWLQEYASKIGYAFYVENMTIYMRPMHRLLNESVSNSPTMGLELPSPAANVKAWDRTLDSFVVERGDYFDGAETLYTVKATAGVNPLTSKRIKSKSSPAGDVALRTRASVSSPVFEDLSNEVVHSSSFSKRTAKDLALAARFNVTAKLRGQGDPRIRPYGAVYVLNTGTDTDGFWSIKKAHHSFNITGLYEVSLDVATDGIGPNSPSTFRKAITLQSGTIDIEAIFINDLSGTPRQRASARLISKTLGIKETDQGFGKTNVFWSGN